MTTKIISNTIVPESDRMTIVDGLFGLAYVLRLEPAVFSIAEALAEEYTGGFWEFHELSNGGFFMAPRFDTEFTLSCENGFDGKVSPDAFGITVCLYAYSEFPLPMIAWLRSGRSNTICCGNTHPSTPRRS
jgi:hypothetical protein